MRGQADCTTYGGHVSQPQDEADRVEDVGFARAIEAGNGVERGVPAGDLSSYRVRLESWVHMLRDCIRERRRSYTFQYKLFDPHRGLC
jgi:hypothetical protein